MVIALAFHLLRFEFKTRLRLQLMKLSGFMHFTWCTYEGWLWKVSGWASRCVAGQCLVARAAWGPYRTPPCPGSFVLWYVTSQYINSNRKKTPKKNNKKTLREEKNSQRRGTKFCSCSYLKPLSWMLDVQESITKWLTGKLVRETLWSTSSRVVWNCDWSK